MPLLRCGRPFKEAGRAAKRPGFQIEPVRQSAQVMGLLPVSASF